MIGVDIQQNVMMGFLLMEGGIRKRVVGEKKGKGDYASHIRSRASDHIVLSSGFN